MTIDQLIKKVEEAEFSHIEWAEIQVKRLRDKLPLIENTGGVEYNLEWALVYVELKKILIEYKNLKK
jgi:hypothetical protein